MGKKYYLIYLITLILFGSFCLKAQTENVGIGTTSPDASSILELYSTNKGFLVPRMTTAQRDAISNPATGLLIYNTNNSRFEFNVGTPASPNWQPLIFGTLSGYVFGTGSDGQVAYWNSSNTITGSNNFYWDNNQNHLGLGNNTPRERLDLVDNSSVGAIILGSAENSYAGSIQWNGSDFLGYDGSSWVSLTSSSTITGNGSTGQITFWSNSGVLAGNNNLYWDNTNSIMGIGTSSPASTVTLDVNGNVRIQGDLEVTGQIDPVSLTLIPQNSTPTAVKGKIYYSNTDNQLKVYNGSIWNNLGSWTESGGNVYRASGNVAIGRTSPRERLDIQDASGDGAIIVGNTANNYAGTIKWDGFDFFGYDGTQWLSLTSGGGGGGGSSTITGSGEAGQVTIWSSTATLTGNNNLYWNNISSRLGIGDNTPDHSLDVNGNIGLQTNGFINFGDTDGASGYGFRDNGGTLQFKNSSGTWADLSTGGGDVYGSGTSGYIAFWNSSNTITGVSNLFWDNTQTRLGIGDNTPDHTVDIAGNLGLDASSYINFGDTDGASGYGFRDNAGTIEYKNSGGSWSSIPDGNTLNEAYNQGGPGVGKYITVNNGTVGLYGSNSGTFTLELTNTANGGVLRIDNSGTGNSLIVNESSGSHPFVISSNGTVGIGTSSPNAMLEITPGGNDAIIINPNSTSTPTNLKLLDAAGGEFVGFSAPNAVSSSIIWKLPSSDGSNGQVLTTDGSGNLSWTSVSGGTPAGNNGAVQYNNGGNFGGDETQFFWDDTNNRLGLGTSTPNAILQINGGAGTNGLHIHAGENDGTDYIVNFEDADGSVQGMYIDASGDIGMGNTNPQDKLEVTGAVLRDGFFMAVRSSHQTGFDDTEQNINWNSQVRYDTDYYTHSTTVNSDQITIDVAGWYRISYNIRIDNNFHGRQSIYVWLEDDGTEITGSRINIYARADGQGQFTGGSNSFIVNITANSVITMVTQSTIGSADYTVQQNSQITIERIDQ